jgi:Family of unknown function (DUF6492)
MTNLLESTSAKPVALVTPSHSKDLERFALLCESIDRLVLSYDRHYVIVNDDDMAAFAKFNRHRRVVLPCSQLLPRWLKPVPSFLSRKGRRLWWSFRSTPVHGWHVQQILKIAAASRLPEQRFCFIDSDNVFVRPFDVSHYAGGELTPLYVDRAAIVADSPMHANWIRNGDRLLGQPEASTFPADDFIGNVIVWDKHAVQDMTATIARATGMDWELALCKTRAFSEYLLYGQFVRMTPRYTASHRIVTESLANAYWDGAPLGLAEITALIDGMTERQVALCIESFSGTPVTTIREAVGLSERKAGTIRPGAAAIPARERSDVQLYQQS